MPLDKQHPATTRWLKKNGYNPYIINNQVKKIKKALTKEQQRKRGLQVALNKFKDDLRSNPTPAEKKFIKVLGNNEIWFRFQQAFPNLGGKSYIVDFCIPYRKKKFVVVEIDGGYHNSPDQKVLDALRTKFLKSEGCRIIRFTNDMVMNEPLRCMQILAEFYIKYPSNHSNYLRFKNLLLASGF